MCECAVPCVATGYCKSEIYSQGGAIATANKGSGKTIYFLVINNVCCNTNMCTVIPRLTSDPANEFFG